MLLNFDGNMNIAMSIRSAAVMGCSDIWIVGKRKYDARPEVGAKNYIRVHKIDILENPREFFESKGVHPILVEQGGVPLETMNFKRFFDLPVCFIMGSEGKGVPREWIDLIPTHVSISQYGLLRSFNVSIAASIVMYEYVKQLGARVKES
jgi:tRNA G18 (ribose-2'-O)-methylase SpoU